jgi:hypothetical protein
MKILTPLATFSDTIDACIEGIGAHQPLRERAVASKDTLLFAEQIYRDAATLGDLSAISIIDDSVEDVAVVGTLLKSDLVKLYDSYFSAKKKPGRRIYSELLNAAREECPFCGGIGTPLTLDHFLPKAKHPTFSVLPINLVPACRDCNMGAKGQKIARNAEEVALQPYVDKDIFFDAQWIFATYSSDANGEPGRFLYFVRTPASWDQVDTARAKNHFASFDLAHKYGLKAAQAVATVLGQIKSLTDYGLPKADVMQAILQPGIDGAPFANHWQRGMYQALDASLA